MNRVPNSYSYDLPLWQLLLQTVAEDAENFRCGGGLLDYVQILYGNKGSQQKYGLEVPHMKKNT